MIIYNALKSDFMNSVAEDTLAKQIETNIYEKMGRHTPKSEFESWRNSLTRMYMVMNDPEIPDDTGVAIEYNIPQTAKRVDFIISGYAADGTPNIIIVELKQWSELNKVDHTDSLVETFTGGAERKVVHPSYQAWSYAQFIADFNTAVQDEHIGLHPCAYLHNYDRKPNDPLDDPQYDDYTKEAPAFTSGQVGQLRAFIRKYVRKGDRNKVLYEVDHGKIRPSKSLQDSVRSMIQGNPEFTLIDEQRVAYEQILRIAEKCRRDLRKRTVIVKGGPGTGKSVIAIRLLAKLTQEGQLAQYVSKNSAPRQVYCAKLKGVKIKNKKSGVDNLFKGSGTYVNTGKNDIPILIVDDYAIIGLSQRAA